MEDDKKSNSIKTWAIEDRPREKLLLKGKEVLSDAELIAILIGSGNSKDTAVELARRILQSCQNNLEELGKTSLHTLQTFRGIGEAKAIAIVAAMELGRRRQAARRLARPRVMCGRDAFNLLAAALSDLPHEAFWILVLNRANEVLAEICISEGGVHQTVVDVKKIFQRVLAYDRATGIILAHNHPSGGTMPSQSDIELTQKIYEAGKVLDITVHDHLILAGNSYSSFVDLGKMPV